MLRVLIVDEAEEFRVTLADALKQSYDVQLCADGKAALELAGSFSPDILVLDLTLSGIDGLGVIQMITQSNNRPMILATTRFISDYLLQAASRIGVDYMMVKPCNIKAVASRISDLASCRAPQELTQPDLRVTVANLLLVLGIATNLKGYHCLREAIPIYSMDPDQSITKELYPAVGKACGADPIQVERAMRGAIEKAWENRDDQIWRLYFTPRADGIIHKPSNSEFISRLADYLGRK